jgi:hypothetical protein
MPNLVIWMAGKKRFRNAVPACVLLRKSFRNDVPARSVTKIPLLIRVSRDYPESRLVILRKTKRLSVRISSNWVKIRTGISHIGLHAQRITATLTCSIKQ